ncbi:MAG TPA: MBOAT family O-acyltransferase, partial [Parvularculaceae bacterium]|nr:MBOAT family O-acyltransferase [Parvularculaceae bacterium]
PNYGIIADFIILTPLLLLLRAALPRRTVVEASFTLVGAYLIYTAAPRFLPFYALYWAAIYALQWAMWAAAKKIGGLPSKILTAATIVVTLSPMVIWKLWPAPFVEWFTATFARVIWTGSEMLGAYDIIAPIVAPIGLSFATFRALDLLIKIRLDLLKPISPLSLAYYGFFGPVLAVGPVIEFEEVRLKDQLSRFPAASDIGAGLFRIALGAIKVMALAYFLSKWSNDLWHGGDAGWAGSWGAVLLYGMFFYVNFSGYSDLAIGASRLHGVRLKENFNNPYTKTNPQLFWASWHMSLTRWCQRYVFVPLGGMRASRQYIATFFTIMTIALWHGISWTTFIFGSYHAAFLIGHRFVENRRMASKRSLNESMWARGLKSLGVFIYMSLSLPLLALPLESIPEFYGKLVIPGVSSHDRP